RLVHVRWPGGRVRHYRPPGGPGKARSALADVGQAADQPPALGFLVQAPALVVGDDALDLGVAVDQADLDGLLVGPLFRGVGAADVVAGDLVLLVALHLQVAGRALRQHLRVDEGQGLVELAPADGAGVVVERLFQRTARAAAATGGQQRTQGHGEEGGTGAGGLVHAPHYAHPSPGVRPFTPTPGSDPGL